MRTADTQLLEKQVRDRVWGEVFGSGWESYTPWMLQYRYIGGNWEKADAFFLKYEVYDADGNTVGTSTKRLLPQDIVDAWLWMTVNGYSHCGYSYGDLDSFDSCAGSGILERAVYKDSYPF